MARRERGCLAQLDSAVGKLTPAVVDLGAAPSRASPRPIQRVWVWCGKRKLLK